MADAQEAGLIGHPQAPHVVTELLGVVSVVSVLVRVSDLLLAALRVTGRLGGPGNTESGECQPLAPLASSSGQGHMERGSSGQAWQWPHFASPGQCLVSSPGSTPHSPDTKQRHGDVEEDCSPKSPSSLTDSLKYLDS